MGAFRRAKYGEIKEPLREERLAKQLGISLEDYMKTYGKNLNPLVNEIKLTEYKKISEDADAGRNALNNLNVMQSILDDPDFKTGTLENAKMKVRAVFDSLGMLNDENTLLLKEAQTFDALSNNSILPLVKMLGVNPTDRDLMFVQSAAPTLSKSKETNKLLIKSLISAQKRKVRLQQVYAEMSAENPTLDHPTLQMNALQQVANEFESEMNEILAEAKSISDGVKKQVAPLYEASYQKKKTAVVLNPSIKAMLQYEGVNGKIEALFDPEKLEEAINWLIKNKPNTLQMKLDTPWRRTVRSNIETLKSLHEQGRLLIEDASKTGE